jgi:hypothetical protein
VGGSAGNFSLSKEQNPLIDMIRRIAIIIASRRRMLMLEWSSPVSGLKICQENVYNYVPMVKFFVRLPSSAVGYAGTIDPD